MNKRLAAGSLAALTTAAVLALPAAPAAAAGCGASAYGSSSYTLVHVPTSARVRAGTEVTTRGTLTRAGTPCERNLLGYYVKRASEPSFYLRQRGFTDSTGSLHLTVVVDETVRTFFNLALSGTTAARSSVAEYVVVA